MQLAELPGLGPGVLAFRLVRDALAFDHSLRHACKVIVREL